MTSRVPCLVVSSLLALAIAGCASAPVASSEAPSSMVTTSTSDSSSDNAIASATTATTATTEATEATATSATTETKRDERPTGSVAATSSATDAPRSTWRTERDTQRDSRAATNTDAAKLVEQLNDASRELATLRVANAKVRGQASAPASPAQAKADATDEKLVASLKSYANFKQEMVNIFADMERMRKEHAGLSSNLKAAVEQADQARAAMGRLEDELRAEKRSRAAAEQAASKLEDQLRAIARALSSAGLNVEKMAGAAESGSRRDGGSSR